MDQLAQAILESWDRQTRIFMNLAGLVDETNRSAKPAPEGWSIDEHLAHVHSCRRGWLAAISPESIKSFGRSYEQIDEETWVPIKDLDEIKRQLNLSGAAIRTYMEEAIEAGTTRVAPYDHPIFFLQHMLWHDGYHFGLIVLALRNAGIEPTEEWEERNVWGIWRDPEI